MIGHAIDQNNFYTMPSDPSLENLLQFDYPVEIPSPGEEKSRNQNLNQTRWPVANPEQPLH
jgi:hypothetical protein